MDRSIPNAGWAALAILLPCLATAQDPLRGTLTMGLGDIAAIKQKAEAGDAVSQITLGESLASHFRATEALEWYRKAALQGNVQGEYLTGNMLLFGAPGIPNGLTVRPNQPEGIRWTFLAATNLHAHACWNMGKALRDGLGTSKDPVAAYAWLSLFANTSPGSAVGRVQMNELALQMDSTALQRAQGLAAQFKAGKWQKPIVRVVPDGDTTLKLGGITLGGKMPLAVINGKTLSEGESSKISLKSGTLTIKCLKIQNDYVQIAVEGEDMPRVLRLK